VEKFKNFITFFLTFKIWQHEFFTFWPFAFVIYWNTYYLLFKSLKNGKSIRRVIWIFVLFNFYSHQITWSLELFNLFREMYSITIIFLIILLIFLKFMFMFIVWKIVKVKIIKLLLNVFTLIIYMLQKTIQIYKFWRH